jgi:hypothetical protein
MQKTPIASRYFFTTIVAHDPSLACVQEILRQDRQARIDLRHQYGSVAIDASNEYLLREIANTMVGHRIALAIDYRPSAIVLQPGVIVTANTRPRIKRNTKRAA